MREIIVEDDFFSLFPNAKIGIIACYDIDNSIKDKAMYIDMINDSKEESLKYLKNDNFSENDVIKVWRDAFKKFKTKKGARSSIEALLKRVKNNNDLKTINPLVDIYNSISLRYGIPCGGEDIDTFVGNVRLTKALGNESFVTLGSEVSEPPYENEIVYKDDVGIICRCWNWRESVRTMLTEDTKNAFLCIELVDKGKLEDLENALNNLEKLIKEHLGGECKVMILDINNNKVEI